MSVKTDYFRTLFRLSLIVPIAIFFHFANVLSGGTWDYLDRQIQAIALFVALISIFQLAQVIRFGLFNRGTTDLSHSGFVYLLSIDNGIYKIGHTANPDRRFNSLIRLPYKYKLVRLIHCADRRAVEKNLHERFADKRINGEWFKLTDDDIRFIQSLEDC